jgi:hypothetical protein
MCANGLFMPWDEWDQIGRSQFPFDEGASGYRRFSFTWFACPSTGVSRTSARGDWPAGSGGQPRTAQAPHRSRSERADRIGHCVVAYDRLTRLIEALGEMGPLARPAIPVIRNILDPPTRGVHWMRFWAPFRPKTNSTTPDLRPTLLDIGMDALRKIDPNAKHNRSGQLFDEPQQLKW